MRQYLGQPTLALRAVAIAVAYVIAIAGVIGSANLARAAAASAGNPLGIICHTDAAGEHSPSTDDGTRNNCADTCCTGCVMLMAALPPPPATAVPVAQTPSRAFAPIETAAAVGAPKTKSHQSRAPPQSV